MDGNQPKVTRPVIAELARLETAGYIGLLGTKYLSSTLTSPDTDGNRVTFININPTAGWAIVAYGPDGDEQKHNFLRDVEEGWIYDGEEKADTVH